MGWGIMPDVTDEKIVCQSSCKHSDCKYWRELDKTCEICGKEIEAGHKIYQRDARFVHAVCAIKEIENDRGDKRDATPTDG